MRPLNGLETTVVRPPIRENAILAERLPLFTKNDGRDAEPTAEGDSTLAVEVLYFVASVLVAWIALMATPVLLGPVGGTTVLVVFLAALVLSFAALLALNARR